MAFDPFSSGGASNFGSHVSFAPIPIGPVWNPDPATWQPAPGSAAKPAAEQERAAPQNSLSAKYDALVRGDHSKAAQVSDEAGIVEAFAQAMALQTLTEPTTSTAAMIARKLPGSPENVYGQMEALREEEKLVDARREFARKMAKQQDEMTYRD